MKYIASVSFGKDSLAMLLKLIELNYPLDEVVFYDTGMEFQAIYNVRDKIIPILDEHNIKYIELKPKKPFLYTMFEKPVKERSGGVHYGYSWCGGRCRWGTTEKLKAMDKYAEEQKAVVYVGIASDEPKRIEKERKEYKALPLVEWNMTEKDCLDYCYEKGFFWEEKGIKLYDILDRVSCWCCSNKNLKELKNIYTYLPPYWNMLKELQKRTDRPMKGENKSVFDLEKRFEGEKNGS
jgi:3'-phosphoadenosine 5'-phosphosulfate sulfotransferase (PAPS reductase)/FAD synthetase